MSTPIRVPLFDASFGEQERAAALAPIQDGWLTLGPRTERFERAFGEATGAAHVVAVSSGTAALHLSLRALDIGPGDEVICPSLTFVATANAVRYVGARPVFCDIVGPGDLNLDPDDVERRLTPRTRAVLAVHYGGFPADLPRLSALCEARGLALVEDSAHACVSTLQGRACGSWGACGCFSFYSNKNITCGEGGAVVTGDERLADRLRLLRSHAMTAGAMERHQGRAHSYDVVDLGYNYRIDEVRSSLLLAQLGRLDEFLQGRADVVGRYGELLRRLPVEVPDFGAPARGEPGDTVAHHIYPVLLPPGVHRTRVMDEMRRAGVQTAIHYPPVHQLRAYASEDPLPRTEAVAPRELTLPLFPTLSRAQSELVCESLGAALAASGAA